MKKCKFCKAEIRGREIHRCPAKGGRALDTGDDNLFESVIATVTATSALVTGIVIGGMIEEDSPDES